MCKAFAEGKDIYATIASIAFHKSYEECLEFHPETGEYQPEGKKRRSESKLIVLGISYGRSVPSIGQQLYGNDDTMTDEEKTKNAQEVYDSVLRAFPNLKSLMQQAQAFAHKHGYVETILGRRRHLSDMMLEEFEFEPLPGYVNPDIDPLDLSTLDKDTGIPESRVQELRKEFSKYKYFGQIMKRTKELYEKENIKVINNRPKINDAKRQCVNCVDKETEILTFEGWKKYDQIVKGEMIPSYSLKDNKIVVDEVLEIHEQRDDEDGIEVYRLSTNNFDACCTKDHRWVMRNFDTDNVRFYDTNHILRFHRPRYHILRIANNEIVNESQAVLSLGSINRFDANDFAEKVLADQVSYAEIFKLTFANANLVFSYLRDNKTTNGCIDTYVELIADKLQAICFMAGKVGNKRTETKHYKKKEDVNFWKVSFPKRSLYQTARIDMMKKEKTTTNIVWCVTTNQGTWIARRNGKYYITGNSIIQGSAADFSKTALINVSTDPRWKACGGEVLTIVHDEIVAQAPIEYWEEAANILREDMEKAGDFLPFPINCDVTVSYRWYGLEAPCKYPKPKFLRTQDYEEICWIQYHLVELDYHLPNFKDADGNDPIGDAAHGVSGIWSDELDQVIENYCNRYNIREDQFLDDIEQRVEIGFVEKKFE